MSRAYTSDTGYPVYARQAPSDLHDTTEHVDPVAARTKAAIMKAWPDMTWDEICRRVVPHSRELIGLFECQRYFKNVRCSNWAMVQRDRDDSGARLHGLSTRHRPNGSRSQFLHYLGHGGPVRPLVSYDDDGNPD